MSSPSRSTDKKPASKAGSPIKGKGKGSATHEAVPNKWEDVEDDESDGDEEEDEEEDDEEEEDNLDEIDPRAITGRRTRGVRVDYTSKEALAKAGLIGKEDSDDEDCKMD